MNINEIGNKIANLPEHLIPEVLDYIAFLKIGMKLRKLIRMEIKINLSLTGKVAC